MTMTRDSKRDAFPSRVCDMLVEVSSVFQQPHHLNRLDTSQWKRQGQNGMDMGRGAQDAIRLEPLSLVRYYFYY